MSDKNSIFSLVLAGAMLLSLTGCKQSDPNDTSAPPSESGVAVQTETVSKQDIATENKVSGKVVADSQHIISVASNTKCTAVYVQAGEQVRAGQKLCTLDMANTIASYNAANISYDAAVQGYEDQKAILDEQLRLATENVHNTEALFAIGAASQLEVDQAKLSLQQAEAGRSSTLSQLEAGMQNGKANVEQLSMVMEHVDGNGNVIAPAAGTLVSLSAVKDGFVSPSAPVAVIDGVDQMKIMASVSESLVPKLQVGDEVDVYVSAVDASFTGTIRAVERSANPQTGLYSITVSVPADAGKLMAGMSVDLTFHTDRVPACVVVPAESVLTEGDTRYVYVVEEETARRREVTVGLSNNGVTQITSGLAGGEQLVVLGQAYLEDGMPVRVIAGEG